MAAALILLLGLLVSFFQTVFGAVIILAVLLLPIVWELRRIPPATTSCAFCRYPREGIALHQPCPECGEPFVPNSSGRWRGTFYWRRAPVVIAAMVAAVGGMYSLAPDAIWIGPHRAATRYLGLKPNLPFRVLYDGFLLTSAYSLAIIAAYLPMKRGFTLAAWGVLTPIATIHAGAAISALAFPRADIHFFGSPFLALFALGHALGWSIGWLHQRRMTDRTAEHRAPSATPADIPALPAERQSSEPTE